MDEISLIENLYFGSEKQAKEAIDAKRNWIEGKFFIPGNFEKIKDKNGLFVYPFLDAMNSNSLLFSSIEFSNPNFTAEECELIEETSQEIATITLYDEMHLKFSNDFWVRYDFRIMDLTNYYDLVANFYHCIKYEDSRIDKSRIKDVSADLIKALVIGHKGNSVIIINKAKLNNMCYYCPIISKIFYRKRIRDIELEKISIIARKLGVEIEEIDE